MNYFAHNPLNRFSELRADAVQVERLWRHKKAQVIVVSEGLNLLLEQGEGLKAAMFARQEVEGLASLAQVQVYLGTAGDVPYFALGFEKKPLQVELLQ
ncbi:MAG: hypothetical protein LPK07_00920 [Hymenobacteraceae bacterium]|nr:hypothetical protein [Hymenobacteraceae bacterium]MDX5480223.1 hypothetical protein [Hymenobacteraceae bacterium]